MEESEEHDEVQVLHVVPAVVNLDDSVDEDNVGPDGSLLPTASSSFGTDLSVRRHALERYWDLVKKGKKKSEAKTTIAKFYQVDPRTVARWIQNEPAILSTPAGARPMTDLRAARMGQLRRPPMYPKTGHIIARADRKVATSCRFPPASSSSELSSSDSSKSFD